MQDETMQAGAVLLPAGASARRPAQDTPAAIAGAADRRWLRRAAAAWVATAALGLAAFALYVVAAYARPALHGDFAAWNKHLAVGYAAGDRVGNLALGAHLLLAVIVTVGGVLQLVPAVRARAPRLHRWNGRVFMLAAVGASLSGIYRVWARGTVGDWPQHAAITFNGVLILAFAALAWRDALRRRFDAHRRWAVRLFLAANGVWFFRVGLMLWLVLWQRPVGFDAHTFRGPFLTALACAQFLLPLALFELFSRAQAAGATRAMVRGATGALGMATLLTAVGIFGAVMGMWWPVLAG